jgi:hypothetical protein
LNSKKRPRQQQFQQQPGFAWDRFPRCKGWAVDNWICFLAGLLPDAALTWWRSVSSIQNSTQINSCSFVPALSGSQQEDNSSAGKGGRKERGVYGKVSGSGIWWIQRSFGNGMIAIANALYH